MGSRSHSKLLPAFGVQIQSALDAPGRPIRSPWLEFPGNPAEPALPSTSRFDECLALQTPVPFQKATLSPYGKRLIQAGYRPQFLP